MPGMRGEVEIMALLNQYRGFTTGQIYEYTYSPKGLVKGTLEEYDKRPLLFFVNYDNIYRLISGINLHWLTEDERKKFFQVIYRKYKIEDLSQWGRPINWTWDHVKSYTPWAGIAWRRYFPARIRNIIPMATTYDKAEIEKDVIKSDTARIIGVTSEVIQRHIQATQERNQRAAKQRYREALAKSHRVSSLPKGRRR